MLPARLPFAMDTRRVRSFDGTEIAYHVTGGSRDASEAGASSAEGASAARPWIVLADGMGGGLPVWRGQIDYLCERYRFLSWDYRGLYASERPRPERPGAFAVTSHVRDLEAVLAAERVDRAVFAGWSLGVQVVLEALRSRLRDRVRGLVLVNGVPGRPLDHILPRPLARRAALPAIEILRRAVALDPWSHRRIGRRTAAAWVKRLGLVGPAASAATVAELDAALAQLDLDAFFRNLRGFGLHDAEGALAAASMPALVVAGDRDPFVPLGVAQQMARHLLHAEIFVVRGGAHCAPVEHPDLLSLRIERFLTEHAL